MRPRRASCTIDGKVAREALASRSDQGPLTLVSAWATQNHVLLGQVAGPKGSNELGALPQLLDLLDLHGAIVTLDALGCQTGIVRQIVEGGGDYVISVKGNQDQLETAVLEAFTTAFDAEEQGVKSLKNQQTHEQSHGRRDQRSVTVLEVSSDFPHREQWAGLKSLVMVVRDSEDSRGQKHSGVRYFISNLPAKVKKLAAAVRSHWKIENALHWVLDVDFREDRNRARADNEQANLGVLRRSALGLLKNAPSLKGSMHCRRQQAAWSEKTLEQVLFGLEISEN